MSKYTIEKLSPSSFHLLLPLMEDCFGMDVNLEYFNWKYLQNPSGEFIGFIARENDTGEIGGYYGVIPQCYSINGVEQTIYQSCDTMTHSRHRRRGLFEKLATHCYHYLRDQDNLFVIGFGGKESMPGLIKLGWKKLFNVRFFVYPKSFRFVSKFRSIFMQNALNRVTDIHNIIGIEDLIYNSNTATEIHSVRRLPYYSWRIKNPLRNHQIIGYYNKSQVCKGYICFDHERDKITILDFAFEDNESRRTLFTALKNRLRSSDKGIVAFCQENCALSETLKSSGFILNPFNRGPGSVITPFGFYGTLQDIENKSDPSKWLVNSYDHDAT